MESFFVYTVLVGIFVVCFALIWMVVEKKNAHDYRLEIEERKYELQRVIEDAEQLLYELNNFSGYIVDRLEEKQKQIEELMVKADEKIGNSAGTTFKKTADVHIGSFAEKNTGKIQAEDEGDKVQLSPKKGKFISLDERKHEVMKLYNKGISSTEIARMLNMGKGEIELISRMCK